MSCMCSLAKDLYVPVKIDENDLNTGVFTLLETLRPDWPKENIKLKVKFYEELSAILFFVFLIHLHSFLFSFNYV